MTKPYIHETAYIAPTAVIIGDVHIGKNCSVFPHAVIRGDENTIHIDEGTNIQDCCVIHVSYENKTIIGKNVTIGHAAVVHGATIDDNCLIGIHTTILNGSKIHKGSMIGAGAVVTPKTEIPENSLVLGIPGKVVKKDPTLLQQIQKNAQIYIELSQQHKKNQFQYYKL